MKTIPWIIFGSMLLFAILYVTRTVGDFRAVQTGC
jgi:hypothetical protein